MTKETAVAEVKTLGTRLATLDPIGYAPFAPGTWGSVAGLFYGAFVQWLAWQAPAGWENATRGVFILFAMLVAFFTIRHTEALWQTHDDGRIVIDELAAQAMVVVSLPWGVLQLVLAFVLFRLFDIWKPGPIGWCDRNLPHAFGTLLDDVVAGIFAILTYGVLHYGLLRLSITI